MDKLKQVPKHTDVLVVGGGLIGSFVAYWLRTTMPSLSVTVVERDSSVSDLMNEPTHSLTN